MTPNVKADTWLPQVPADSTEGGYELGYLPGLLINTRSKCPNSRSQPWFATLKQKFEGTKCVETLHKSGCEVGYPRSYLNEEVQRVSRSKKIGHSREAKAPCVKADVKYLQTTTRLVIWQITLQDESHQSVQSTGNHKFKEKR
jgi:hypothetical protein